MGNGDTSPQYSFRTAECSQLWVALLGFSPGAADTRGFHSRSVHAVRNFVGVAATRTLDQMLLAQPAYFFWVADLLLATLHC